MTLDSWLNTLDSRQLLKLRKNCGFKNIRILVDRAEDCDACNPWIRLFSSYCDRKLPSLHDRHCRLNVTMHTLTIGYSVPSYRKAPLKPPFQTEAKCEAIDMKITFYSHAKWSSLLQGNVLHLASLWKSGFWNSEMVYLLFLAERNAKLCPLDVKKVASM